MIGAALEFQGDPLTTMLRYQRRYGDVVHCPLAIRDIYLLSHPDDVQSILVGKHAHVVKDDLTHELSRFVGQGLLTAEGQAWRRQRRIAAPSFQRRHIERFAAAMVDRTHRHLADITQWGRRDVHHDMMRVTLEIVLDTMFGADTVTDIDSVGEIVETMMSGFAHEYLSWRRMLPRRLRAQALARMDDATARLDTILYDLIGARRKAGPGDADLLDRLLGAQDDDGQGMTDRQLRDEVATVFLAGHETTALALSYALHLLAEHPHTARALATEVDEVLGSRAATADDMARLPFTTAVLRESMRLFPPAYLIGREVCDELEIAGFTIPRGAQVLTPQWVIHRDPRWYEAPEVFWPERWLDGLAQRLHRFAYFPFGGGPRVCVGNHFALLEGVLVLATLAQQLEFHTAGHSLELLTSVTLRPTTGVWIDVQRRAHSAR